MAKRRTPTKKPPWKLDELAPEVAVVVALKEEFEVLRGMVGTLYDRESPKHRGVDYYWIDPGSHRRCVASFANDMSPEAAMNLTNQLMELKPQLIVNIGIAGALHSDLRICDVIVPGTVIAYDRTAKAAPKGKGRKAWKWVRRGAVHEPSDDLVRIADHASIRLEQPFQAWEKMGEEEFEVIRAANQAAMIAGEEKEVWRPKPALHTKLAHLASGHFVATSNIFADWVREGNSDIKAIEMEAAGMLEAVKALHERPRALVIRGISDHIDFPKEQSEGIEEGALRRLAMRNAVRFFQMLLRHGGLLPSERKTSKKGTSKPQTVTPGDAVCSTIDAKRTLSTIEQKLTPRAANRLHAACPSWPRERLAEHIVEERDPCVLADGFARAMHAEVESAHPDPVTAITLKDVLEHALPVALREHATLTSTPERTRAFGTRVLHEPTIDGRMASIDDRPMKLTISTSGKLGAKHHVDLQRLPHPGAISPRERAVDIGQLVMTRLAKYGVSYDQVEGVLGRFEDAEVVPSLPAGDVEAQLDYIRRSLERASREKLRFYSIIHSTCSRKIVDVLLGELPLLWLVSHVADGSYELDNKLQILIEAFYADYRKIVK